MHAGLLSDIEENDVAIEVFKEDRKYTCSINNDISCSNNGMKSRSKKYKVGFRFVDTSLSCKFYSEKISNVPF